MASSWRSGATPIASMSTVSRTCDDIEREIASVCRWRLMHTALSYVLLGATHVKARVKHRVMSYAVVIATGVTAEGAVRPSASAWMPPRAPCSGQRFFPG